MNLSVVRLIAGLLRSDQHSYNGGESRHPAAVVRLVVAVTCILLCALSRNAWFTLTVIAVELVRVCMKTPEEILHILRPVVTAAAFAAVFTLPAVVLGSPGSFGTMIMKVTESVLVLSLLNEEVSWKETTGALQSLHLPAVVVITLDSAVRFLVILGRFSHAMLEAVSLRRVGRRQWRNAGTGGIVGTTFLKSRQLAAETEEAMRCRGFSGEFRIGSIRLDREAGTGRTAGVNLAYLLLLPLLIAGFWYTQRMI